MSIWITHDELSTWVRDSSNDCMFHAIRALIKDNQRVTAVKLLRISAQKWTGKMVTLTIALDIVNEIALTVTAPKVVGYRMTLVDVQSKGIDTIRVLRAYTGLSLKLCKEVVEYPEKHKDIEIYYAKTGHDLNVSIDYFKRYGIVTHVEPKYD